MKRDTDVIDKFYRKGLSQKRIVFQLLKDEDGRYEIRRGTFTLMFFSKEQQSRISFEILKGDTKKIS